MTEQENRLKLPYLCTPVLLLLCLICGSTNVFGQHKDDKGEVFATVNGRVITSKEVDELLGNQLQELQEKIYFIRKTAINNLIITVLLEEEAKVKGVTIDELKRQLIPSKVEVPQRTVDEMYDEAVNSFTNMSQEEAKERIRLDIESHEKMAIFKSAIEDIKARSKVELHISPPPLKVAGIETKGPVKGRQDAPITIVEFSDFQCPYCKQAKPVLDKVLQHYGDKVKLAFVHLPLTSIHPQAFAAAQASICADKQGKFWEYQGRVFDSSPNLALSTLEQIARELKLNLTEFNSCMASDEGRAAVLRDLQIAKKANIQGTPTFVINGQILKEAVSVENFKNAIDAKLIEKRRE